MSTSKIKWVIALIVGVFSINVIGVSLADGHNPDQYEQDRIELRAILSDIETAINENNIEKIKEYILDDAIVTFQNADVVQGFEEIKGKIESFVGRDNSILTSVTSKAEVDVPAVFYGDSAVAAGKSTDRLVFVGGLDVTVITRWTASLVKADKDWKVSAIHFSNNIFDNPILSAEKNKPWIYSAIALILGVLIGWIFLRKKLA